MKQLLYLNVNINKYNPLRASSYIKLPAPIERKKAVVNIQNVDNYCFGWAITSALVEPTGAPNRVSSYPDCREFLTFNDIEMPMKLRDIPKFERYNPQISVNVYGLESRFENNQIKYEIVGPLHYSKNKRFVHINLLLISDEGGNSHYCWIKNFSRLVSQQITSRDGAKHFCFGCLHYFRTEQQLLRHMQFDCNHVYTKLPTTDVVTDRLGNAVPQNILKFENYHKQLKVPFVVYADFETIIKPLALAEPDPQKPFTIATCEHQPYSFAYLIKCSYDDNLSKFQTYRGENVPTVFMQRLDTDIRDVYDNYLKHVVPMIAMTPDQIQNYDNATFCHICDKPFGEGSEKVRDHCHVTGTYRGAAHSVCNLNFKIPNFIPVFFHNLNYDSHLFVKHLALSQEEIDVIPQTKEKYISFGKRLVVDEIRDDVTGRNKMVYINIKFLDSFKFMNRSLSALADYLAQDQFIEVKKHFGAGAKFEVMRRKGVFPYSYVDSFEKLEQERLPSKDQFYDTLNEEHISQSDYDRAVRVWNLFDCKTLGDYSDIYLKADVLILTDVFENFRTVCLQAYKLDPAQYYTDPGLSWDAMLRYTGVELELLVDMDMLHFFKKGIRGGVSTCVGRKAIANNKFVPNYDPSAPTSFIMYLDATNLYGFGMRQYLPQRNFSWLSELEIENFDVSSISDESDTGYVLEVDLQYPEDLHDAHNDLPFCPELIVPPHGKYNMPKLIPNLNNKTKYVIHYRNLKQCLAAGLILTKTHRILSFTQSPWLQPYIDLNTRLRNGAENEFEKDFFKAKNNSVFGKTMENVDKRVDIKLASHWEKIGKKVGAEGLIAKTNFKDHVIFSENLIAVELQKTAVVYNKPIYVGFSILDISKTVMYNFYYNYLKRRYGSNVSLLYTDTDSLVIRVHTENFYDDMKNDLDKYDTSNYRNNRYGIPQTVSVVGKMKDEYAGIPIESFFGAGAKVYCVFVGGKEIKKAKGVRKSSIKKYLTMATYRDVVENVRGEVLCRMFIFRSRLHTVYTEMRNKIALTSRDDKRYLIPNSTNTLAWGHKDILDDRLYAILAQLEQTVDQNQEDVIA